MVSSGLPGTIILHSLQEKRHNRRYYNSRAPIISNQTTISHEIAFQRACQTQNFRFFRKSTVFRNYVGEIYRYL